MQLKKMTLEIRACASLVGLVFGLGAVGASAQAMLEEVIVTAQKREQNLQDVPIAVSAFTGDMLAAIAETVPLSRLMGDQISALRKWAKGRCRPAAGTSINEKSGRKIAGARIPGSRTRSEHGRSTATPPATLAPLLAMDEWSGRRGRLLSPAPHRSGRARLTHPAPQARGFACVRAYRRLIRGRGKG